MKLWVPSIILQGMCMLELSDSQTGVTVSSPSGPSRTRSAPHSSDASCAPYVRRIGTGDVDALADMTDLATELDEAISHAITGAPRSRLLLGRDRRRPRRHPPGCPATMGAVISQPASRGKPARTGRGPSPAQAQAVNGQPPAGNGQPSSQASRIGSGTRGNVPVLYEPLLCGACKASLVFVHDVVTDTTRTRVEPVGLENTIQAVLRAVRQRRSTRG